MSQWNKCPGCSTTVSGYADFCPNCGEPWTITCRQCKTSFRFWKPHKFCPACGAPINGSGAAASDQAQAFAR